ncbi:hypothetical protein CsSME_00027697 [Camellia sinensis var. sinensis]
MTMLSNLFLILLTLFLFSFAGAAAGVHTLKNSNSNLTGIEFPDHMSFNAVSASPNSGCGLTTSKRIKSEDLEAEEQDDKMVTSPHKSTTPTVKLDLKHRSVNREMKKKDSVTESTTRDLIRIQTLHTRIVEKKNQNTLSRLNKDTKIQTVAPAASPESVSESDPHGFSGQMVATLESGVSLGSGEYFMDVFVGTPPKHFSLILDTGSDLNWIQCVPCYDCFEQSGPHYNPNESTSFRNIGCHDPRCHLVASPDPPLPCKSDNQTCPYYYWYGDSSNTTGDFALETFTVNLTRNGKSEFREVENVMFGCGHWNRGLFHGAAGLLGLGRGPLSFSSQLQSFYGHSFSYCLVDRNSDSNVSSKLLFGEDKELLNNPLLNFTSFVGNSKEVDTFYYLQIKSIVVGGEVLKIPQEIWNVSGGSGGGTIIDSGTTLSYFASPAYKVITEAFVNKVGNRYPIVRDYFPILDPCYNVSGVEKPELPTFGIQFGDGALWNFPVDNYFIRLEAEEIVCLAIAESPRPSTLSIIGNYQQQNFHILYDTHKSRLGFAPTKCADL